MTGFKETATKQAIRRLILEASSRLQRQGLTYLGMPAENALDILVLQKILKNVICIAEKDSTLDETRRSIATLSLKHTRFLAVDMWNYLCTEYPREELLADVTFLDFYGGGLTHADPFAVEIAGLRSYFAKHSKSTQKAFVLAWTYMPRDKGPLQYIDALGKILPQDDIDLLKSTSGVTLRSLALRLLLRQQLREHDFNAKLYHHAVYKRVMNTIIVLFSKGIDMKCTIALGSPELLVAEPCCIYDPNRAAPRLVPLLTAPKNQP